MSTPAGAALDQEAPWSFLTHHAYVLLCLAMDPEVRIRSMAEKVGISGRAVQKLIADLEAGGYLTRSRRGRRNRYALHLNLSLKHPLVSHRSVSSLLALVLEPGAPSPVKGGAPTRTSRRRSSSSPSSSSAGSSRSAPAPGTTPRPRAPPRQ